MGTSTAQTPEKITDGNLASDDQEHVAYLMWAASVMAREIELCAGRRPELDQATVQFIVEHLRSASFDFHKLIGMET